MVSDESLDGAVEPDIWEGREAAGREGLRVRWPKAYEAHVGAFGFPTRQRLSWIGGKIARENGKRFVAVECTTADLFAGKRIADNARQFFAVPFGLALTRGAHRRQREYFHVRAA